MPTPVSVARQCLTEEAALALDDAVAVARRRNHPQTTSLHAVSALLALPSSTLRDACTRARTSSYSPRLQLRALELSVGVSLDRLPSSKTLEEDPPVSNSLMAAIKRSQANQRRHPESFHLLQMHNNQQQQTLSSLLKVQLKHFILSILDDPIVSRVFCHAGFGGCDVKLALLQPLLSSQASPRFSRPIFLCNLETGRPGFNFPFTGNPGSEDVDENCRRIVEVLVRKTKRNPLLMGIYAKGALRSFTELVHKGKGGVLGAEIAGLSVISIEKEISEFLVEGGNEENMGLKFQKLGRSVEQCSGPGIAVSFGEVEAFVGDAVASGAVRFVVSLLTRLLEVHGGKLWLVGVAGTSDAYSKFLALFPTVEKDWDLHLLTVTSAIPSMEGLYSKTGLMGSFVPFGGFFCTPSEIKNPESSTNASFTRCNACNEKCEQEVADTQKLGPATLASSYSTSLPWLRKVNVDSDRGLGVAKADEENTNLNAKILGSQRKWSDICQCFHHARSLPEFGISQTRSQAPSLEGFQFGSGFKESSGKDPSFNEPQYSSPISCMPKELQSIFPSKQISPVPVPSDTPVTTDLGLGTLYTSTAQEPNIPKLRDHKEHLKRLSDSLSADFDAMNENTSHQIARSSSCSGPNLEWGFDSVDFKSLNQLLTEKVWWQNEALYAINQTLFLCKSGAGKRRGFHVRADIWFAFLGPDRIGKKKTASALAEVLFGNKESLIAVDLCSHNGFYPLNSIFECQKSYCHDMLRRKTAVDYIAGELRKKPRSVIFLESADEADYLVQTSLLQAIRTGKFRDSHGREISINNAVFIVTSTVSKDNGSSVPENESKMFSEKRILEAKRFQMQLLLGHTSEDAKRRGNSNVKVAPRKGITKPTFLNKRKQVESGNSKVGASCKIQKHVREASRSYLDLNMPLDEVEKGINYSNYASEPVVENSEAWFDDFCGQLDEKVIFKPFNFDALAEKILKNIGIQFQRSFGSEILLEIDYEVMAQILAAAWLSDNTNAVEDWVELVLGRSFTEAMQKYHPAARHVMKLVNCESIFVEEQASGVCLPARINLN